MPGPYNGPAIIDAMHVYFVGQKTGADVIRILGPAPHANNTQARAVYEAFRSGMINGLNHQEYLRLVYMAFHLFGKEGKQLLGCIFERAIQDGHVKIYNQKPAFVPPPQNNENPAWEKIKDSMGDEIKRVLADHSLMQRNGTLKQYLRSP